MRRGNGARHAREAPHFFTEAMRASCKVAFATSEVIVLAEPPTARAFRPSWQAFRS